MKNTHIYKIFIGRWDSEGLKKYMTNSGWMLLARIVTFITSFLTIAIVARYLGPENLGKLSYAQSFVALFSILASLGIDQILIREFSNKPNKHAELLGTAVATKLLLGLLTILLAVGCSVLAGTEPLITFLVAISAFAFLVSPFGTVGLLFQSDAKAKYSSQVTIANAFVLPALKLLVIFFDKGVIFFAAVSIVEPLISSLYLLYIYKTVYRESPFTWTYSFTMLKELLHFSWPLALASGVGYIYAKIDQVMLLHFLDASAVGLYSSALKVRDIVTILPGIVIGSLFPALLNSRKTDMLEYMKRARLLGGTIFLLVLFTSGGIALFSYIIINIIFGGDFIAAASILQILIWSSVGTISVAFLRTYLIAEYQPKILFWASFCGSIVNVILNAHLIPTYGANGAATATLVTYAVVILVLITNSKTRRLFKLHTTISS